MYNVPKISIIVPVYNTELYLEKCLNSILNQSVTDFELILVDDGSTDGSGLICDNFAKNDRRVKVIHKKNAGQGIARNVGLDICKGLYITFVDSDDCIDSNYLELLLKNAEENKADISCAGVYYCENRLDALNDMEVKTYSNHLAMQKFVRDDELNHSPVAKLFKREIFNNVRFIKLRGYEDTATIYKAFINARVVVSQKYSIYFYFQRENSTMRRPFSEKDYDRIVAYRQMEKGLMEYEQYRNESFIITAKKIGAIYYVVGELLCNNVENKKDILHLCQKEAKETLNGNQKISIKNKIILSIICTFPKLFGLLYKVKH